MSNAVRLEVGPERGMRMSELRTGQLAVVLDGCYRGHIVIKAFHGHVVMLGDGDGWRGDALPDNRVKPVAFGDSVTITVE